MSIWLLASTPSDKLVMPLPYRLPSITLDTFVSYVLSYPVPYDPNSSTEFITRASSPIALLD